MMLMLLTVVNGEWQAALPDRDFALAELPRANLCSYCFLALLQAIQSTPYSNYDESFVEQYKEAQAGKQSIPTDCAFRKLIMFSLWGQLSDRREALAV